MDLLYISKLNSELTGGHPLRLVHFERSILLSDNAAEYR
jgi:hypothetical protein